MAKMPCLGCGVVAIGSRCPQCKAAYESKRDAIRGNSTERGYDSAWQKVRIQVLNRDNWTCQYCFKPLVGRDATVDHIIALINGGARLDPNNLVSSSLRDNSSKAGR